MIAKCLTTAQTNGKQSLAETPTNGEQGISALTEQLQIKDVQLQRKDEQLEALQTELSEARRGSEEAGKRSDMLLAQITSQLDRAQNQLEDVRIRPSFWQRVVGKRD